MISKQNRLKRAISDFVKLCRYAAKYPQFVQGGGGNCSVKFNGKMIIKASGYFLSDVSKSKGGSLIDLRTGDLLSDKSTKPSLEKNIHLLLGKCILHTHPIVVCALVCSKQGKKSFKKIFKSKTFHWINYTSPGKRLAEKIGHYMTGKRINKNKDTVLFLENHGIFISSNSWRGCISLHQHVLKKLMKYFGCRKLFFVKDMKRSQGNYLTPDHAIYSSLSTRAVPEKLKRAINESKIFSSSVKSLIRSMNWDVKYLSKKDANFILNMDDEKYRKKFIVR